MLTHPHEFAGELAVKNLPRLVQAIGGDKGSIKVHLVADRGSGFARLHGKLEGVLNIRCQRCGKRYDWSLDAAVNLRLVFSEPEEKAALQGSDPYLVENDELPVKELVEDEVLLTLPMLVRCKTCENAISAAAPAKKAKQKEEVETRRDNPFAALKGKLKK